MSLQDLALPIDVPWKLVATSNDMLAKKGNHFPHAMWRSSLAIFAYDPDLSDLPEVFPDRAITFLKVVCSITSYTPPCKPYPKPPERGQSRDAYETALAAYLKQLATLQEIEDATYPCAGAFIQVAISPKQVDTVDVTQLAYFAGVEPRKRELIEVATASGEAITQSKSAVNVRKGVTSTDSAEDLNVLTGVNLKAGYAGAEVGGGVTGEWGTIKKSGSEHVDVTNTDASREARETASHSTSLSQLYHLLNSYHTGTNRVEFFLQPRPHTLQQKDLFTFIDGPQEIEGIQEFFLVVSRPKATTLDDYCVDAVLYTAHLESASARAAIMEPKTFETNWYELWAASKEPPAKDGSDSWLGIAILIGETLAGIPPGTDPMADTAVVLTNKQLQQKMTDAVKALFNLPDQAQPGPSLVTPSMPTIVNQTFAYDHGWRVDRTRGLGGYDLWEDPNNHTQTALGDDTDAKPQAFIDIISTGSPDNPLDFWPDSDLRVQAWVFSGPGKTAMYHGRIKTYFIRDDLPSQRRAVPMLVTARSVSTCVDSPFYSYYDTNELTGATADIIAEAAVHPPNVAPWSAISPQTPPQAAADGTGKTTVPPPIASSKPSGLTAEAIGAARAKMANGMSDEVRTQLKATVGCANLGPDETEPGMFARWDFRTSDTMFQRLASNALRGEIGVVLGPGGDPELARFVRTRSPIAGLTQSDPAPVFLPIAVTRISAAPAAPPAPKGQFPALTLGSRLLSQTERDQLHSSGIVSTLDLIGFSADQLALRLGTDVRTARQLRLKAVGIDPTL